MNRKKIVVAVVIVALLAAIGYGWSYYRQQHDSTLTLYGNADIRTVNLGFRVGGRLASLAVDEGDDIKPGQLLGKLDDGPYINALKQAQANVQSAQAQLALLKAGYRDEEIAQVKSEVSQREAAFSYADSFLKRQQGLWASKATSANELENARTARNQAQANLQASKDKLAQYLSGNRPQEIAQAEANLAQAEAELAQAQLNLQDATLLSPSSGTVLTRAVEPGTILSASNTVFTLSLTDPVWVRAYVSERNLDKAIPGTQVEVFTDGRPNKPYHGKIGFVSPTAEFTPKSVETPDLRTDLVYRLRIIITDADESLRQGMPVTVRFAQP
ncbi:TPA: secretion protein HlyD [Yersinia enterocolitica]|uniref:secretion protein HlyD n=1 Tax=Yersinia TaxID=629 RepID=UPI0005E0FBC2|nr:MULTISPECIES: secretion protein HlyD [Yersinia]OWF75121.1 secretion protein HlyD [Yersinia frederiksenii]PHZ24953.1 secretion protein HlyD [Yersinia massiliensis]CNF87420.1 putative membrane fusion protein (MFP) component of efflux pump%2C membrane anchor protein YbhG [Yersinia frederiksenii]CQI94092.1 putative membrane fusion protein (MFP) component of efflux pump%2C membrane anchor protein YbhG [Yersinia frederiksenii]